jgi:molecular chaperone DnaK
MQAASAQMYQGGQAGPQPGADQGFAGGQQSQSGKDDIQDADFEEVK